MFCTNCGARLGESSGFCPACGEPAAQVLTAEALNPSQKAFLLNTQKRQLKGRRLGQVGLGLGIFAIVLSLTFAPFIYVIFSRLELTMTGEEWIIAIFTVFLYFIAKAIGVMLEGLASASLFILPCVLLQLTGLTLGIVGRAGYKEKKFSLAAIIVNGSGLLLQIIIIVVCIGMAGNIPIR